MHSYYFHVGDYLTATRHLNLIEDIAYRRLLDLYYTKEEPLPASVARCAKLIAMEDHEDSVSLVIEEFFTESDGKLHHARCDAEIAKYQRKAQSALSAGAIRSKRRSENRTDDVSENRTVFNSETSATSTSTSTSTRTSTNKTPSRPKREIRVEAFEEFWQAYPRKVAKGEALKSWGKVNPDETLAQQIIASVKTQSRSDQWTKDGGRFIPHPSTWLNQQRWLDVVEGAGSDSWESDLQGAI